MIGPGTGVRVYLACGVTDMRKGIAGLAALAQDQLRQKPASGAVFAFRGKRGDRVKLLYWDGQGFCLYYKVLERGRFPWPSAGDGAARLTAAGAPLDFADYQDVEAAVASAIAQLAEDGFAFRDVCIDTTAGTKVVSIASAVITMNKDLEFSYVTEEGRVWLFDARLPIAWRGE